MDCLSDLKECPGKYCARTVLNASVCLLTECQVRLGGHLKTIRL